MKTLIDQYRTTQRKFFDAEQGINMTKVIIASNEQNVAGTEIGDRRYVYLPVSDERKGDTKYFEELMKELENGGRESFLKFMLDHKSEINLNKLPGGQSQQRTEDIVYGSSLPVKFIYDLANNGIASYMKVFNGSEDEVIDEALIEFQSWERGDIFIDKRVLVELYHNYCDRHKQGGRFGYEDSQAFYTALGKTGAGIYVRRASSKRLKENAPIAGMMRNKKEKLRLSEKRYFLEKLAVLLGKEA
jgi:hypothetical protein